MEKRLYLSELFFIYMELLTERQREVFELHHIHDFSFSEIAEELSVSRQAINDILHKTVKTLNWYESKLRLYEKYQKASILAESVSSRINALIENGLISQKEAEPVRKLFVDILGCYKN